MITLSAYQHRQQAGADFLNEFANFLTKTRIETKEELQGLYEYLQDQPITNARQEDKGTIKIKIASYTFSCILHVYVSEVGKTSIIRTFEETNKYHRMVGDSTLLRFYLPQLDLALLNSNMVRIGTEHGDQPKQAFIEYCRRLVEYIDKLEAEGISL